MNPSNAGNALFLAQTVIADPGPSGILTVDKSLAICNLVTAAAETRTLPRPWRAGTIVTLIFRTDGGDCVVTVTGGYNTAGTTVMTFTDAGQFVMLQSFQGADGVFFWRVISNSAIGAAPVAPGAPLTAAPTPFTIADPVGTPDNAIAAVTSATPFGFSNAAELITVLYALQKTMVRVAEIEARLEASGVVTPNLMEVMVVEDEEADPEPAEKHHEKHGRGRRHR